MRVRWILAFAAASLLATAASALTVVNRAETDLDLYSPVVRSAVTVGPGGHFAVPPTWGDDRHLYFEASMAGGDAACGSLKDRYGTVKVPSHWAALAVAPSGTCTLLGAVPESPPADPNPDPSPGPDPDPGDSGDSGDATPPSAPADPTPEEPGDDSAVGDPGFPPRGNGTWVYDATFPNGPAGEPFVEPGLWRDALDAYNERASSGHRLDQIFSYGGDLEMECDGGSDCTPNKMHVYYYPPTAQNPNRTFLETGASGFVSTQAYAEARGETTVIPIFDGRFDSGGYLQEFETLSEAQARTYADIFARTVCADPAVPGVQLDLEPFDITEDAQAFFYDQLATNLAGANPELESIFRCKTDAYPKGRFFSVFTFANQITPELGAIFTRHGNGYVIISLYDLGPGSATVASDPDAYQGYVENEIARTVSNSVAAGGVPFQLAIPAAASTKEFESYRGTPSGYTQLAYVEKALDAIDASGVRDREAFLGVAVWGWSRYMAWPAHTDGIFEPGSPPTEVLSVLEDRL